MQEKRQDRAIADQTHMVPEQAMAAAEGGEAERTLLPTETAASL